MSVRPATVDDVDTVVELIRDLAEYERELAQVEITPDGLRAHLFGDAPAAFAHVAVDDTGETVGFALWFLTYSTWTGVHGIHLEDLYVRPSARGGGHGRALLAALAGVCAERGYRRLEWAVLNWNVDAIGFYRSLGAGPQDEWTTYRLTGDGLAALAAV